MYKAYCLANRFPLFLSLLPFFYSLLSGVGTQVVKMAVGDSGCSVGITVWGADDDPAADSWEAGIPSDSSFQTGGVAKPEEAFVYQPQMWRYPDGALLTASPEVTSSSQPAIGGKALLQVLTLVRKHFLERDDVMAERQERV